jgi:predicted metal-dependent hydrolase
MTLIVSGEPDWLDELRQQVTDQPITVYHDTTRYIERLSDDRAALLLVDGRRADWRFWTTTVKVSPATRRIPVLLVTDDVARRAEGLLAGADWVFSAADLREQIQSIVRDYARLPDPQVMAQLECECQEALPPLAVEGVAKFNAGEYYPQHDLFEEQWVNTSGPVRDLYRAILQVGVAYYQIERGNYRGAKKMLLRSIQWLTILPDVCQGVDVRQLREDSACVRAELERLTPETLDQFDRSLLKPLRMRE